MVGQIRYGRFLFRLSFSHACICNHVLQYETNSWYFTRISFFYLDRETSVASEESGVVDHAGDREPIEDDNVADLGKPRLGDVKRCSIKIKESTEFKV